MKATMGREKVVTIVLTVLVLLLAGLIFWEWEQGRELERELLKMRNIPVTQVPAQKILAEFQLPDVATGFPELVARNLFALNRRSVAPTPKGGVSAMKKGQFVLVGVLITPKQRSALLRDVQTNKTETVALVGVVRGMTLGDVQSSRVILRQGTETEELALNVQTGPKPPSAAQAQTQAMATAPPPPSPPAAPGAQASAPAASPASAPSSAPAPARAASANPAASAPATPGKPADAASGPKPSPVLPVPLPNK